MDTISERFKYLLKHRLKFSQKKFAQLTGLVEQDTTRISTGAQDKNGLTGGMREKIEQAIKDKKIPDINLEWLEYGRGNMLNSGEFPPIGKEPNVRHITKQEAIYDAWKAILHHPGIAPEAAADKATIYADAIMKVIARG